MVRRGYSLKHAEGLARCLEAHGAKPEVADLVRLVGGLIERKEVNVERIVKAVSKLQ